MAQNCARVRPEAGKRASRSIHSSRVAARDRAVRLTGGATTTSDIGIPPRERATSRSYPMRQGRDLAGAYSPPGRVKAEYGSTTTLELAYAGCNEVNQLG